MIMVTATNTEAQEAQRFLRQIKSWPHWETIRQVAQKEYGLSAQDAEQLLKEYQRFLALIKLHPNKRIGMYSSDVDKLWHAHILSTRLYADYCERHHGHFLHHSPTLSTRSTLPICDTPPETPPPADPPSTPPPDNCVACDYQDDPRDTFEAAPSYQNFILIYFHVFQEVPPPTVWDVHSADTVVTI